MRKIVEFNVLSKENMFDALVKGGMNGVKAQKLVDKNFAYISRVYGDQGMSPKEAVQILLSIAENIVGSEVIEITEDVALQGLGITLERGDRIEVLKEAMDPKELVDLSYSIDFKDLISHLNYLGIPVKKINIVKAEVTRGYSIIKCEGDTTYSGKQLGVFSNVLKSAKLTNFNTDVSIDNNGKIVWWSTWVLEYTHIGGGFNSATFMTSWYHFDTKEWEYKIQG